MPAETMVRRPWLRPLILLGSTAAGWILLLVFTDYMVSARLGQGGDFFIQLSQLSAGDVQQALGNMPEVVVAILGVAITVISIILQLSATRYTPRVADMFFLDKGNLLVIGFFVVASIQCIWASLLVHENFLPRVLVTATLVMMTAAILILIPYFAYVFAFLNPERIVMRLQDQALAEALNRRQGRSLELRQDRVLEGIEQLADVAVNSISQKDRIIASRAVDALRDLVLSYVKAKDRLPATWFTIHTRLRRNPDFVAMAPTSVDQLSESRTWLEWKVLRQYQTIANESLNKIREINQLVAIDTRYIGEAAIKKGDRAVLGLVVKFFNTYLRASINSQDVRSAYNILHQYRLLGEALLRAGWADQATEVGGYFKYYGLTANARGIAFINETAAYDLCTLCEVAHLEGLPEENKLLEDFLDVDKQPETEAQEQSLRGVRKAQIKLATFYLQRGEEERARRVWRDMEQEKPDRLLSIRQEMIEVTEEDFWEVVDRGLNFDYLEPSRRAELDRFYAWFPELTGKFAKTQDLELPSKSLRNPEPKN